MFAFVSSDW